MAYHSIRTIMVSISVVMLLVVGLRLNIADALACTDGEACGEDEFCCDWATMSVCVGCCASEQCAAVADTTTPYCDTTLQECVECLIDADCTTAATPFCVDGACTEECTADAHCLKNQICNTVKGTCVCSADMQPCNGPNQLCDISGNCAACMDGFVWNNGVCVPDCNPPCKPGFICGLNGMCMCPGGTSLQPNGQCIPCVADCLLSTDCQNVGELCVNNKCVCPTGQKTYMGQCVAAGDLGGWCLNGKCKGKRVTCNHTTNMCECSGNCVESTICLKTKTIFW